jgi:hypothetical protein
MSNTITPTVFYRTLNVEGLEIFYREAGPRNAPTVLLLHGFPSSSHMFRNLIPMLADKYHVDAFFSAPKLRKNRDVKIVTKILSFGSWRPPFALHHGCSRNSE